MQKSTNFWGFFKPVRLVLCRGGGKIFCKCLSGMERNRKYAKRHQSNVIPGSFGVPRSISSKVSHQIDGSDDQAEHDVQQRQGQSRVVPSVELRQVHMTAHQLAIGCRLLQGSCV